MRISKITRVVHGIKKVTDRVTDEERKLYANILLLFHFALHRKHKFNEGVSREQFLIAVDESCDQIQLRTYLMKQVFII